MKRYIIGVLVLLMAVALVFAAKPDTTSVLATNAKSGKTVVIPAHAVQVADNVFSLGTAMDNGRVVEGYAIVDYKEVPAKPPWAGGKNNGETCYGFLAKGAKWKGTPESYIIDPTNIDGLSDSFVRANIASDIDTWEDAADGSVDGVKGADILGDEVAGVVNRSTIGDLNGKNEVIFADVGSQGAIAVTIVWGIFGGPPSGRELVEWDQVYDDVDFDWTEDATIETTKMDFWNIAIHELGHSVGLDDLYNTCTEETMYGYGTEGETKKRDLNAGDITGITKLYS